jgi:hypothetical protein
MPTIEDGYVIWARQTLRSAVFRDKPAHWFKVWFHLTMSVSHTTDLAHDRERGTGFFRYADIVAACNVTKSELDHMLRWFRDIKMITTRRSTRGFFLTILDYGSSQDPKNYKSPIHAEPEVNRAGSGSKPSDESDTPGDTPRDTETSEEPFVLDAEGNLVYEVGDTPRDTPRDTSGDSPATHARRTRDTVHKKVQERKEGKEGTQVTDLKDTSPEESKLPILRASLLPPQQVVDLFNSICVKLPAVQLLTHTRRGKIKTRNKEMLRILRQMHTPTTLETFWTELFSTVNNTPFLCGEEPSKTHPNWSANFDWLTDNDSNYIKVLEGNYKSKKPLDGIREWLAGRKDKHEK